MKANRPLVFALTLVGAIFALGLLVPYEVGSDLAFQLKSVQQWRAGASPLPNVVLVPDPQSLDRSLKLWGVWWPVGGTYVLALVVSIIPHLASALRTLGFCCMVLGLWGWSRVFVRAGIQTLARTVSLGILALASFLIGGAFRLATLDILGFAVFPWLVYWMLLEVDTERRGSDGRGPQTWTRFALGFILGSLVWLKYSLIVGSTSLLAALAWCELTDRKHSKAKRWARLALVVMAFAFPIAGLSLVNQMQRGVVSLLSLNDQGEVFRPAVLLEDPATLALSLIGAPGLTLGYMEGLANHISYFTSWVNPDSPERLQPIFGILGTIVLFACLGQARAKVPASAWRIAAACASLPFLVLCLLGLRVGFNFLCDPIRFVLPVFGLPLAVFADQLFQARTGPRLLRIAAHGVMILALAIPGTFALMDFTKNGIVNRVGAWRDAATGLFVPSLGDNGGRIVDELAARHSSGTSVLVLAVPGGDGTNFSLWLLLSGAVVPLNVFAGPLADVSGNCFWINSRCPFSLGSFSEVAVLAWPRGKSGLDPERLLERFPEVRVWQERAVGRDAEVVTYVGVRDSAAGERPGPVAPHNAGF